MLGVKVWWSGGAGAGHLCEEEDAMEVCHVEDLGARVQGLVLLGRGVLVGVSLCSILPPLGAMDGRHASCSVTDTTE